MFLNINIYLLNNVQLNLGSVTLGRPSAQVSCSRLMQMAVTMRMTSNNTSVHPITMPMISPGEQMRSLLVQYHTNVADFDDIFHYVTWATNSADQINDGLVKYKSTFEVIFVGLAHCNEKLISQFNPL